MSNYQVLVDSSVWIEYFKRGYPSEIDFLIKENLICTNEIILTELMPVLKKNNQDDIINGLRSIDMIELDINWENIREYQLLNLNSGLNHIGIPDLIIIQQVIEQKLSLLSFDKHFKLMKKYLQYELFEINS